ncbi:MULTISPECIES: CGNR zinc finger domain-containing protein [Rhizobiaceae]|jgi:predicted RNA-binding Zn ribbon-like protein|uniref:Putative RNA-binding Zn ribbon-like protein n=1 Tax=Aliirhizobium cellulosilyticum TaxID=393664 RepID=A0A7W6Y3M0_9HYPH|nr:CGNR zinc finger domain-containing protein [Rhizobium cellulosilyticum]MBB4350454.1 putative RNA-binding Zn ribbon-like protein [Rhizobium cellulosilyticum]MBB4413514.1 putative RNA-binding Zn ribbon-like protein [Rhizobium cellulosilyticum]MBB4448147.1 putative RNA-binding Zn ribbon-like protein [Rhizobium cellulosilyticum]
MTFSWTPHRFAGGALALDVANSVILRFNPARSVDRFAEPAQLNAFAKAAGEFSAERALFGTPAVLPKQNEASFIAMREAIDGYFRACVSEAETSLLLASLLEAVAAVLRLGARGSLETETAYSALRLLSDTEKKRIRICGNCGWLFIDRSKNRSRIWCDMTVCGNRVKAARHYNARKDRLP